MYLCRGKTVKALLSWRERVQWPCTIHLMTNPSSAAASETGNLQAERVQWCDCINMRFIQIQALLWAFPLVWRCTALMCFLLWIGQGYQGRKVLGVPVHAIACPAMPFWGHELSLKEERQISSMSVVAFRIESKDHFFPKYVPCFHHCTPVPLVENAIRRY